MNDNFLKYFILIAVYSVLIAYIYFKNRNKLVFFEKKKSLFIDLFFVILKASKILFVIELVFTFGIVLILSNFINTLLGGFDIADLLGINNKLSIGILFIIIFTFADYLLHSILHTKLFWPIHRLHHSASILTPFTSSRNHPFGAIFVPFLRVFPIALFGSNMEVVTIVLLANLIYQPMVHSDLESNWGWFGKYILLSPVHHKLHHSINPNDYGKNLSILAIWDHLFGTYKEPPINKKITTGVNLEHYEDYNFIRIIYVDFIEFVSLIKKKF